MRALILCFFLLSSSFAIAADTRDCSSYLSPKSAIVWLWERITGKSKKKIVMPAAEEDPAPAPKPQPKPKPGNGMPGMNMPGKKGSPPSEKSQAHNKNTDTKAPEEDAEIMMHLNAPGILYFGQQSFAHVNPNTGDMQTVRARGKSLTEKSTSGGLTLTVHAQFLPASEGYLFFPAGYHPTGYAGSSLEIEVRPQGVYYRIIGEGDFTLFVEEDHPRKLSAAERAPFLNSPGAPALSEYPEMWRTFLEDLIKDRSSLGDIELAQRLRDFISGEMLYEVDASPERGVLAMCEKGSFQCDGASLIFTTILRSIFQIPSYPIGGITSSQAIASPNDSVVLDQATPHMFTAVYDPESMTWKILDPTPSKQTREKDNKGKEDQRFREWPRPDGKTQGKQTERDLFQDALTKNWAAVFDGANTLRWQSALSDLKALLQKERDARGLTPDLEIMARNVEYVMDMASAVPRRSLTRMATDASTLKNDPLDYKTDYIDLQILARLGSYGARYAKDKSKFAAAGDTAQKILKSLPAAKRLSEVKDMLPQMPGEFSREALTNGDSSAVLKQMAALNKLVKLKRLRDFSLQPSTYYDWSYTHTDEDDDLFTAEDLEHWNNFERLGLPHSYDAVRVQNEDMLVRRWKDPIADNSTMIRGPAIRGKEVTFILIDLSSSMGRDYDTGGERGIVRDRLVQMWIDELLSDNNGSIVQIIPYTDTPHKPVILNSREDAQRQFQSMMRKVNEEYFESKGSNDTANAFNFAVEQAMQLGPEYKKLNFRLVTDGAEALNIDMTRNAKDKLARKVEMNLTAVTLEEGNEKLRDFIKASANANLIKDAEFVHLTDKELESALKDDGQADAGIRRFVPENYDLLHKTPAYLRQSLARSLK